MIKLYITAFLFTLFLSIPSFCQEIASEQPVNVFDRKSDIDFFSQMMPARARAGSKLVALQDKRLRHAIEKNNQNAIAVSANNLGYAYLKNTDYVQAIKYFQQSLNAYTAIGKPEGIAMAKTQLAFSIDQSGRDEEGALGYYIEALVIFDSLKNKRQVPFINALQGIIYLQKGDTSNANTFITKAIQQFTANNDALSKSRLYSRLGEVYLAKNQYTKSIESFTTWLKFSRALKDNDQIAIALRNIGIAYFKKGDFDKALDYFNRSLAVKDDILVKKLVKDCYLQMVNVSSFKKEYDKADKYHELYRSLKKEIAKIPEPSQTDEAQLAKKEKIIQLLSMQNEEQNKILTKQDYELSQQLTATEIERQSKEKALEQLTLTEEQKRIKEFELEKISAEKARQEAMLIKQELQLSKQKEYRNIFLMISGIVLLGVFWLYNRYAIKKRSLEKLNEAHARLNETHNELNKAHEQLKQTQEQLIQSEKMASLGQLTAGIAHEIQNPLNFVNNFSTLSIDMLNEFEKEKDTEVLSDLKINLTKINQHGNRISSIVKGMLLHSRNEVLEKQVSDINVLLDESLALAYHGKRSTEPSFYCKLEKSLAENLPQIPVMSQDIRRVFINIINNGFYAVQEKYTQLKSQETLNGYVPEVKVSTSLKKDAVEIIIHDNGKGIPAEIKEKVFNPFFTSKPTGKGTGLGLSVSYDIISKNHGGILNFESEPNVGTTFTILLPVKPPSNTIKSSTTKVSAHA